MLQWGQPGICDVISGLVRSSPTKSAILLDELAKILKEREMWGEISGLQRRICRISLHSIYVNCRCHRLALCFKHLIDQFSWLAKLASCY